MREETAKGTSTTLLDQEVDASVTDAASKSSTETATEAVATDEGKKSEKAEGTSEREGGSDAASKDAASASHDYSKLKVPEALKLTEAQATDLVSRVKLSGHPPDVVQAALDFTASVMEPKPAESKADDDFNAKQKEWIDAVLKDPDIGGDKAVASIHAYQTAMKAIATPGLLAALRETGMASHPEMVRLGVKLSQLVGEDGTSVLANTPGAGAKSWANRLVPEFD